jgi:hypothetical protein
MASPFFFIKKKDGKLQPVQDYRKPWMKSQSKITTHFL